MNLSKENLLRAIEDFETQNTKILLVKRRHAIRRAYRSLKRLCLRSGAVCGVRCTKDSITIRIVCTGLFLSDEDAQLRWLFRSANIQDFFPRHGRLVIDLWFRCWKWTEAEKITQKKP